MQDTITRLSPAEFVAAIAHHEAGHAVAAVMAYRDAKWLPKPPPLWPVHYVEIREQAAGQWSGACVFQTYTARNGISPASRHATAR